MSVTRRSLLLGSIAATAATTAGCRNHPAPRAGSLGPADRAALLAAVAEERRILAGYDALPVDVDSPTGMARDQHAEHLAAMERVVAATSPSSSTAAATGSGLRSLVTRSGHRLQTAAIAMQDGDVAALLASVAAAHLAPPPLVWSGAWFGEEDR